MKNSETHLSLEENAYLIKAYSQVGPINLNGAQGKKKKSNMKAKKDFVNFLDYHQILSQISGIRIHFVEWAQGETRTVLKEYRKILTKPEAGETILMDARVRVIPSPC